MYPMPDSAGVPNGHDWLSFRDCLVRPVSGAAVYDSNIELYPRVPWTLSPPAENREKYLPARPVLSHPDHGISMVFFSQRTSLRHVLLRAPQLRSVDLGQDTMDFTEGQAATNEWESVWAWASRKSPFACVYTVSDAVPAAAISPLIADPSAGDRADPPRACEVPVIHHIESGIKHIIMQSDVSLPADHSFVTRYQGHGYVLMLLSEAARHEMFTDS
ncbi:hypothetical protein J6590_050682 [Homalodisca vitripennis]|nr:hypothetical protein J6590_050682 [Homalodisca vitripennis]